MARNRIGTARQLGEHPDPDYVPSGEGKFSRISAHGSPQLKLRQHFTQRAKRTGTPLPLDRLIKETSDKLLWLKCEIALESDPRRVAKLTESALIKGRYLDTLRRKGRKP